MKSKSIKKVEAAVREQHRTEELEYCPDCHSTFFRQSRCRCSEDEDMRDSRVRPAA